MEVGTAMIKAVKASTIRPRDVIGPIRGHGPMKVHRVYREINRLGIHEVVIIGPEGIILKCSPEATINLLSR